MKRTKKFSARDLRALKLFYRYIDVMGCNEATRLYEERTKSKLNQTEMHAFDAGIAAGNSYIGLFTSWAIKDTYHHYRIYTAGKHLSAHHGNDENNEKIIKKIKNAC